MKKNKASFEFLKSHFLYSQKEKKLGGDFDIPGLIYCLNLTYQPFLTTQLNMQYNVWQRRYCASESRTLLFFRLTTTNACRIDEFGVFGVVDVSLQG